MSTFVIRPGETDFEAQDRLQGVLNLPLTERGHAQVDEIIDTLKAAELEVVYASPTEPALATARRIAEELDIPLKVIDGLPNLDLGHWQGLTRAEIRHKQPRVFRQWEEVPESVCPPSGEPCTEALERVSKALRKPLRRGGNFAIVAPEPLATVVSAVIRGDRPRFDWEACQTPVAVRIEAVEAEEPVPASLTGSWTRH